MEIMKDLILKILCLFTSNSKFIFLNKYHSCFKNYERFHQHESQAIYTLVMYILLKSVNCLTFLAANYGTRKDMNKNTDMRYITTIHLPG